MKKTFALIISLLLLFSVFAGCSAKEETSAPIELSLTELVDKIYENKDPGISVMTVPVDLSDAAALKSYTGLDSADDITEAVASEAAISAQAYSMVLVRLKDMSKASAVAEAMKSGIDQRKWICVEADDLRVAACGDVVLLIMVSSELAESVTADSIVDAFAAACGRSLDIE